MDNDSGDESVWQRLATTLSDPESRARLAAKINQLGIDSFSVDADTGEVTYHEYDSETEALRTAARLTALECATLLAELREAGIDTHDPETIGRLDLHYIITKADTA